MKKLFTSLFLLTPIVCLLCSAPVMAETVLTFLFEQSAHDNDASDDNCSGGTVTGWDAIVSSDFHFSGPLYDAVKQYTYINEKWSCIKAGAKVCTRNDVHLTAGTYTFVLKTTWAWGKTGTKVPTIKVGGNTYSHDDVDYVNDQIVNLQYTGIEISTTGDYPIEITLVDGDNDKYGFQTLTIVSSAPAAPTYAVSVNATNGTVSGTGSFAEGASVTLTPSADPDYSFSGWSDASGISISGQENENPLIFTMPGNAVSITANFTACTKHTVTLTAGANGSVSDGGEFCEGSVTVTATPNTGYRFVNWTNTSTSDVVSTDAEYTFTLLADISLTANFEYNPCTNTKTVQCVSGYVPVTIYSNAEPYVENRHDTYVVTTHDKSAYYYPLSLSTTISSFTLSIHMANSQYDYAWFNLYKKTANNSGDVEYGGAYYNKVGWQHMVSGNWWHSSEFDDAITSFADGSEGVGSSIPSGDYLLALSAKNDARFYYFTLTANTAVFCPNTITMAKSGDASAADPTSSVGAAMAGTVVTVTAGDPSDASHYFVNWTASPSVEFEDANASSTTFVMPAYDVTITANYGAVVSSEFTYSASGEGTISCETASGSSVVSGTKISMTAAVTGEGYVFRGWTATAGTFSDAAALTTTFTMPAEAAAVTATFAQVDNIISQGSETGSEGYHSGATMTESHIDDFGTFGHVVLMLSYSDMTGGNHHGWNIGKNSLYNSANSAGATGFGFYYKTETDEDKVAFCFDHGDQNNQYKVELPATNNVWKYHYFDKSAADGWNGSNIIIYLNGTDGGNTTANANGAIYLADIAATSITSKPDIASYIYTRDISGAGWGTLCLPMDGAVEGATLFSVAGKQEENSKLYVVLQEEPDLVGGQPYIFEKTADELRATMSGVQTPSPATVNGLVGTYVEISPLTPYDESHKNYILALNEDDEAEFQKVGTNVTVGAYRAYINLDGVLAYSPSQAIPGRRYVMMGVSGTQETEDTEDIAAVEEVESGKVLNGKILVNGQLYLMYEGKMYDVQGARVK